MRTTLILRDDLMARAAKLSGLTEKTALVHAGLEALIEKKARERLAALGGSEPRLRVPRRRRRAKGSTFTS
jgi:Arc/MetJ family transcription regulator